MVSSAASQCFSFSKDFIGWRCNEDYDDGQNDKKTVTIKTKMMVGRQNCEHVDDDDDDSYNDGGDAEHFVDQDDNDDCSDDADCVDEDRNDSGGENLNDSDDDKGGSHDDHGDADDYND